MITLDELSALVKKVKTYPIEEVIKEIARIEEVVKYTRHSKKLIIARSKLIILKDFKLMYDVFNKDSD